MGSAKIITKTKKTIITIGKCANCGYGGKKK